MSFVKMTAEQAGMGSLIQVSAAEVCDCLSSPLDDNAYAVNSMFVDAILEHCEIDLSGNDTFSYDDLKDHVV